MKIENEKMCGNELRKAALLITRAVEDAMDITGEGVIDMNSSSGNVYLWLEDERSSIYIGLDGTDRIRYCRSCRECGYENDNVPRKKRNADMICPTCKESM